MIRIILVFISIIALSINATHKIKPLLLVKNLPIQHLNNMSGVLTDIAKIAMKTSDVKISKSSLLRLNCTAASHCKWNNYFKTRDLHESFVNTNNIAPFLYNRDVNEASYFKNMKYMFNNSANTVKSVTKKNKNLKITSGTKYIVSTLYYKRILNYKNTVN